MQGSIVMNQDDNAFNWGKKLGSYLPCDDETIKRGLSVQHQQSLKGIQTKLGEVLVELQIITKDNLNKAIYKQRFDCLKMCPLFLSMTEDELADFCDLVNEIIVAKGEVIMRQDTAGDCFFVLVGGRATVYREEQNKQELFLETVGPGECLGEMAYFIKEKRSASVRALETCKLLKIDYASIDSTFEISPMLAINFMKIVTKRLHLAYLRFYKTMEKSQCMKKTLDGLCNCLDMTDIFELQTGIEGLLYKIVYMAGKVMNADRSSLFLINSITGELWAKIAQDAEGLKIKIPADKGIASWVVEYDQSVNIKDAYSDPRFCPEIDKFSGYTTKTVLCGPVKNLQGEIVGVIQVLNKKGGDFTEDDEIFLRAFAYQAAIAVENFNLYNNIINKHETISILLDVATSLSQTLDLTAIFEKIINEISKILNAERSTLFLVDNETNELWSKVAQGSEVSEIRIPCSEGLAGYVASTGQMLNIENAYKDPRFNPKIDERTGYKTQNIITMPIYNRHRDIIGVTQAINKKEGSFDAEDEAFLKSLTSQIGIALENSLLHEDLKISFDSSISALSATVDARHPFTAGHSERVTEYSLLIAKEMKLDKQEIEIIKLAAVLHDIGKIGIRDDVLLKNGRFTQEERDEMNTHPLKTKVILKKFHFPRQLQTVPKIAALHHEKVNGQGYPYGLKGSQLPLGSKILAVADVFDALTSRRDYPKYVGSEVLKRDPMPLSKAIFILKSDSGSHFDPQVVEVFLNCLPQALCRYRGNHFPPEYVDDTINALAPNLLQKQKIRI